MGDAPLVAAILEIEIAIGFLDTGHELVQRLPPWPPGVNQEGRAVYE